jgi:hypothetical protein
MLLVSFKLRWSNAWDSERIRKEAGLIWLTWHRAIVVNEWRGKVSRNIRQDCPVCMIGDVESVPHRFWECYAAKRAWSWGFYILQVTLVHQDRNTGKRQCRTGWQEQVVDSESSPA